MFQTLKSNLGRRIMFLVAMSIILVLVALGTSAWLAVRQSSERVSDERRALAQATGTYLDYILRQNLERLDNISFAAGVDLEDGDLEPEKRALHNTYLGSVFTGGVFLADRQGTVLWVEPFRQGFVGANVTVYPPVQQMAAAARPAISNVFTMQSGGEEVVLALAPLRNRDGRIVGLAGGTISLGSSELATFYQPVGLGATGHVDIIDANGLVVAGSGRNPGSAESDVTGAEVTESALLSTAPWSVVIGQSSSEALAPVRTMQRSFIVFGLSAVLVALVLSWGMARSLVKPIGQLTAAARNISRGDLSQPVPNLGTDEIGQLGRSFDAMRVALKDSLEEIRTWNRELESKVEDRTRQLEESYRVIERKEASHQELLRKVLTIQEEERKRIARELHDETSQSLVGLVMRTDAIKALPGESEKLHPMLADIKSLAVKTIDNVHKMIFDLRPSVLDDLGLLSAIRWFAGNRLEPLGIKARVEVTGEEKKLSPQVEIALFRIVQEAITNIAKHAGAHNVVLGVEFRDSSIAIEVEDDGIGFDVESVSLTADRPQGVGLLGMRERIALIEGKLEIESQPGKGTRLLVEAPC